MKNFKQKGAKAEKKRSFKITVTETIKEINKMSTQVMKKENEIKTQDKTFYDLTVEEQNAIRKLQFENEKRSSEENSINY